MLEWADRNSAQLDAYWDKYAGSCVSSSSRSGDRPWFAVFETNGVRIDPMSSLNCQGWLDTVQSNAAPIRAASRNGWRGRAAERRVSGRPARPSPPLPHELVRLGSLIRQLNSPQQPNAQSLKPNDQSQ